MAWDRQQFRTQYRGLARFYDPGMWLYGCVGMRIKAYRQAAAKALSLRPGDTVVDLGCGTGLNFAYLQDAVGPQGRIIGVDLTDAMLEQADRRMKRNGWYNVELCEADMAGYAIPADANGVLATLALATIADYDAVVARAAQRMRSGARFANFEIRWPERWPRWLAHLGAWLNRPAGVTPDIVHRLPAEAIRRYFADVQYREVYFGAAYICSGRAHHPEVSHGA